MIHTTRSTPLMTPTPKMLPNAWNNKVLFRLVLASEFSSVSHLLLKRPGSHLHNCNKNEQSRSPTGINDQNTNPRDSLIKVVRTSHPLEPDTMWDTSFCAPRRPQAAKYEVNVQVCKFSNGKNSESNIHPTSERRGICWRIECPRQESAGQNPIVKTVFEDVPKWHGCVGEPVYKNRLKFTFDEMN